MPFRRVFVVVLLLASPLAAAAEGDVKPLPLPNTIRVQSAGPREKVWQSLSDKDRQLVIHLTNAANAGRDLLFLRSHRHAIAVKQMLEDALSADHIADTKKLLGAKGFTELLRYAAKFFDLAGIYAPSNRKYILTQVTPGQLTELATRYLPSADGQTRSEIVRLLTDAKFEVQMYPENQQGD